MSAIKITGGPFLFSVPPGSDADHHTLDAVCLTPASRELGHSRHTGVCFCTRVLAHAPPLSSVPPPPQEVLYLFCASVYTSIKWDSNPYHPKVKGHKELMFAQHLSSIQDSPVVQGAGAHRLPLQGLGFDPDGNHDPSCCTAKKITKSNNKKTLKGNKQRK